MKLLSVYFAVFIISIYTSAIKFDLGFGGVGITHIAYIFIFMHLIFTGKIGQVPLFYCDLPTLFLFLYPLSNLLSSLIFSHILLISLKGCISIFIYYMFYIIARWLTVKFKETDFVLKLVFRYNLISVGFGIFSLILFSILKGRFELLGVSTGHLEKDGFGTASIRSLSFEPNVFSLITASVGCCYIAYSFTAGNVLKKRFFILLIIMGLLLSYTRSVYFSFTVAFMVIAIVTDKVSMKNALLFLFGLISFGLVFTLAFSNTAIYTAVIGRASNIFNIEEGSALGRVYTIITGLEGFYKHPVIGNGLFTADMQSIDEFTGELKELSPGAPGWLFGTWIQALHDTGIIGFLIIIALFFTIIRENYKWFKTGSAKFKFLPVGFMGATILLLISTQSSSIMWVSFPYVFWGINMGLKNSV